ncbi:MAG TPA: PA14 domain-containing protein, partial [Sedimentisphaerales bacterium]|nr:PA14 domain-containing protein [Sedimentisphaerales bacterium]
AKTRLPLSAGKWEFATLSDDGIRLAVDGRAIIDNWTWHGPTRDTGTFELQTDKTVEIAVEHFEIDGYAVLELKISSRH